MRSLICLFFGALVLLLVSCNGSESYRGAWKAMDAEGKKYEIVFDASTITVKDSSGKTNQLHYTQNAVKMHNSERTYGITLKEGGSYELHFPYQDGNSGLIRADENNVLYSIDRKNYISFGERFGRSK